MRHFHTSVLEIRTSVSAGFATEPYECGWASEAIYFVGSDPEWPPTLEVVVQLSPDGVRWMDDGRPRSLTGPSGGFIRVHHFGGWLRLSFRGEGQAVATVSLVLKE